MYEAILIRIKSVHVFFDFIFIYLFFWVQIDKWGMVEGGHDVDIADLRVQISSAAVFLGLSRRP